MVSLEDFIVMVYSWVDGDLKEIERGKRLRTHGFAPALSDAEVIAMEVVGEFLGIDTDKGIWEYFRRHWMHFFPGIGDRTTFARQAANLGYSKQRLQRRFAQRLEAFTDDTHMVDGIPIPVCRFARTGFSKVFRGQAAYGHCEAKKEIFYGFRGHLLISLKGIITSFTLTPANTDERQALPDLLHGIQGLLIGDKGYISAPLHEELAIQGVDLQTPLRSNMKDSRPWAFVKMLTPIRRLIETVIGQLSERFHIEKVRARDLWHQTSRLARKLLAHTVGVFLNILHEREPLQFDGLVSS